MMKTLRVVSCCVTLLLLLQVLDLTGVTFVSAAKKAKKSKKNRALQTTFSGSTSKTKWTQVDTNKISTEIDISSHQLKAPPTVFLALSAFVPSFKKGFEIDLSLLNEVSFENVTGKVMAASTTTDKVVIELSYDTEKTEKNFTAITANFGKYRIKYVGYTKDHPKELELTDKYEDQISMRDAPVLAPLNYLDFLLAYLKEETEVIKPLLGKAYAKPLSEERKQADSKEDDAKKGDSTEKAA